MRQSLENFLNAIDLNLQTFTDFPQAIQELPEKDERSAGCHVLYRWCPL